MKMTAGLFDTVSKSAESSVPQLRESDWLLGLFRLTLERGASDLHLRVPNVPVMRIDGEVEPQRDLTPLSAEDIDAAIESIASAEQVEAFRREMELDFWIDVPLLARFRVNALRQRGTNQSGFSRSAVFGPDHRRAWPAGCL